MESLVLQLQSDCLNAAVSILEVLRKALVVARKLSLTDAQTWIDKELSGYKSGDSPPPYRLVTGQIKARNPYVGWIPVIFQDSREESCHSKCFVGQAIGELEDLVKNGSDTFEFPFDSATERSLMEGLDAPFQPTRHLSRSAIVGVIDAVRNLVLNWCMDLERDGILGEGLTFNTKEKETAAHANYTINYHGPVTNSQIQQGSDHSTQSMSVAGLDAKALTEFMASLNTHLADLKLGVTETRQVQAEVSTVETQLSSPRPSYVILRESLRSIRNILEGCAGSLLASQLIIEIGKFLK